MHTCRTWQWLRPGLRAGTLTQNEMTVQRMWLAGGRHDDLLWLQQPSENGKVCSHGAPTLQGLRFRV